MDCLIYTIAIARECVFLLGHEVRFLQAPQAAVRDALTTDWDNIFRRETAIHQPDSTFASKPKEQENFDTRSQTFLIVAYR